MPDGGGVPGGDFTRPGFDPGPIGAGEAADPEYGRKAANLVLRELQDEIERGEINEDWLKKTGWTPEQARRFADQLDRQLNDSGRPDSPEELARRRQFDEFLRSLAPRGPGKVREGSDFRNRSEKTVFGAREQQVPPEYRELEIEYSRSIFSRESNR